MSPPVASDPKDRCAFAYISGAIYLSAVAAAKLIKRRRLLSSIIAHLPAPLTSPPFWHRPLSKLALMNFFI